jgi:hypothetical protein
MPIGNNMKKIKKPYGYWNSLGNVLSEIRKIENEIGEFPSSTFLKSNGFSNIDYAIKKHGGMKVIRKLCNAPVIRKKKKGKWDDFNKIVEPFKDLMEKLGYFPQKEDLAKGGISGVYHAIQRHGGIHRLYKDLKIKSSRRPKGYWGNYDNILYEVEKIQNEIGKFPSSTVLRSYKTPGLVDAIKKHGGMKKLREVFNAPVILEKKKERKWDDFHKIVELYRSLIKELGRFPTKEDLKKRRLSGVILGIQKHGGVYPLYRCLGIEPKTKPYGYWNKIENVFGEIDKIIDLTGKFPSRIFLNDMGLSSMVTAITKKHGGMLNIRKVYDCPLKSVEYGHYSDFNNVKEVIKLCEEKLGHFPTVSELDAFRPGIKAGILKYHGNYLEVRKEFNQQLIQKQPGYWKDIKKVEAALRKLENQLGDFPTQKQIDEFGEIGLYQGIIKFHGGLTEIREKLGYKPKSKSNLEKRYKLILDSLVNDNYYFDNRKKMLYNEFNIELRNPITNNFLEIDRYYPNHRVAIEIQGEQHKKEIKHFADRKGLTPTEYLQEVKRIDEEKKKQCKKQKITLIELHDSMTKDKILKTIQNVLPIRDVSLPIVSKAYGGIQEEIINSLQKIQSNKKGYVTKKDIVTYSRPLYDDIRAFYGGIYQAREAAGIQQPS